MQAFAAREGGEGMLHFEETLRSFQPMMVPKL